jgi:tetratricopeptide (TPR) repeat protein
MQKSETASKAKNYGVRSIPAVVIDGILASCCAGRGNCYATAGRRDDAFKVLDQLHEIPKQRYMSAYWPATIYAALNEKDQAFHWLDRAYQEHSPWMVYTKLFPWLDNLRSDPRFQDLLRRMNFPA